MMPNNEQMKKSLFTDNDGKNKEEKVIIFNNKYYNQQEKEIKTNNYNKKINLKENNKIVFDAMNDESSYQIRENINNENKINITLESSSVLSDLKSVYNNISKNEYIFNPLNSSIISNLSLSQKENISQNQNNEVSNINDNTNIVSNEKNNLNSFKCTCKNSNCLKCYCECFANGKYCDNCACSNCKNIQEYEEIRLKKYNLIISRNPKAIQKINCVKKSWTCKCKNSNCQKKYCECFQNRRSCTSKCRCTNCLNKNIGIKMNNKKIKIKRIRGLKKDKVDKLLNKKSDNVSFINEENKNYINNENQNNAFIKYSTPKKLETNDNKNNSIYFQNEIVTTALTEKNGIKKKFESKTDKRRDIYTKLKMDEV